MDGIGAKAGKSNRRRLAALELHTRWKAAFFDSAGFKADEETGEPNYQPGLPNRQYRPSRRERRAAVAMRRFEKALTKECERLDRALQIKKNPKNKWWVFRTEVDEKISLIEYGHRNITKGRVRTISSFTAELILAGFKLHSGGADEHEGQRLMRSFFETNGEFYRWVTGLYGIENTKALTKSLCGKDHGKPLGKWVKNFRDRADENYVLPSDYDDDNDRIKKGDCIKSNKERSWKGHASEAERDKKAEKRTANAETQIKELADRIRRTPIKAGTPTSVSEALSRRRHFDG